MTTERRTRRNADDDRRTLAALRPGQRHFAHELWKITGLRTGRLYPALHRLHEEGLISDGWEDHPAGRPPRRWYMIEESCR
jgi:DNA-binding PadR family transcriptional regulator